MDGQPDGNSYMQVVSFPAGTVQAYTFLTYSLSDDPASAHHGDYTRAYGAKQWLRVPFTEREITSSAGYTSTSLRE
jgi:acyl-homoserine-lactone acylase